LDQSSFRNEPWRRQRLGVESGRSGRSVPVLTPELNSASFFVVPRNSNLSFQVGIALKLTVRVIQGRGSGLSISCRGDADGCESFDLELE